MCHCKYRSKHNIQLPQRRQCCYFSGQRHLYHGKYYHRWIWLLHMYCHHAHSDFCCQLWSHYYSCWWVHGQNWEYKMYCESFKPDCIIRCLYFMGALFCLVQSLKLYNSDINIWKACIDYDSWCMSQQNTASFYCIWKICLFVVDMFSRACMN